MTVSNLKPQLSLKKATDGSRKRSHSTLRTLGRWTWIRRIYKYKQWEDVRPILFFLAVFLCHRPLSHLCTGQPTCWNVAPSGSGSESHAHHLSLRSWWNWECRPLSKHPHNQTPGDSHKEELWGHCLQHAGSTVEQRKHTVELWHSQTYNK